MGGDQPPWQQVATEEEGGGSTSSRRNMLKWECDEDLGESATISAVLYCNLRHPEFKQQYPGTTLVLLLYISSVYIWKTYFKKKIMWIHYMNQKQKWKKKQKFYVTYTVCEYN